MKVTCGVETLINGLTGELEDTAYSELEQLVTRTRRSIIS